MPLGLTVTLLVLGGIVLAGVAGYLIEKSPEAADLPSAKEEHRKSR
jgi:hypothetical protein